MYILRALYSGPAYTLSSEAHNFCSHQVISYLLLWNKLTTYPLFIAMNIYYMCLIN